MRAVTLTQKGHAYNNFVLDSVLKPTPGPNDLLVRIHATALNPIDYKMAHYGLFISTYPIVLGSDVSGRVEAIGSNVKNVKIGDDVYGCTRLGTVGCGTFAEYCTLSEKQAGRKPANITHEEAASLGVGMLTAAGCLYFALKLPYPSKPLSSPAFILVWGGASSVGSYAIQLARLSGFTVIGVCSSRNADYVKSLGAKFVFDYQKEDVVSEVRKLTEGNLTYAVDVIGVETAQKCVSALSTTLPAYLAFVETGTGSPKSTSPNIQTIEFSFSGGFRFDLPEYIELFSKMDQEAYPLLESGKLKTNRVEVVGGLESVKDGLKRLEEGKVSGQKLVVSVAK